MWCFGVFILCCHKGQNLFLRVERYSIVCIWIVFVTSQWQELHLALVDNAVGMWCVAPWLGVSLPSALLCMPTHSPQVFPILCSLCHFYDIHCTRDEMIYHGFYSLCSSDDRWCYMVLPMCYLEKCLFRCFVNFQNGLYGLLLLAYLISLYILDFSSLSDLACRYFSFRIWFLFTVQKPFRLMRSHISSFLGPPVVLELCFNVSVQTNIMALPPVVLQIVFLCVNQF